MDPEKMMDGLSKEVLTSLKNLGKAKTAEEKLVHSKTIRNLCESLGVFLNLMSDMDFLYDDNDYEENEQPLPF